MTTRTLLVILLLGMALTASSQEKDFGIWTELYAEHEIVKNLEIKISGAIRTFENSSKIDELLVEGGLQYKFTKWFSLSGSYRLTSKKEDDSEYYFRHRVFLDADASYPVRNIKFSARLRLQRVTRTYIENEDDLEAAYVGRVRLKCEYNILSSPFTPFLYFEAFNPLFENAGLDIYRNRVSAGSEVKISRRSRIEAGYIFQRDFKSQFYDEHIISLAYKYKF